MLFREIYGVIYFYKFYKILVNVCISKVNIKKKNLLSFFNNSTNLL